MSNPLTAESYTPFLRETFATTSESGAPIGLTLTDVLPNIDNDLQHSFSLFFSCAEFSHPQGVYRLTHPRIGPLELYLTPVRRRRGQLSYEASFNLLKPESQ